MDMTMKKISIKGIRGSSKLKREEKDPQTQGECEVESLQNKRFRFGLANKPKKQDKRLFEHNTGNIETFEQCGSNQSGKKQCNCGASSGASVCSSGFQALKISESGQPLNTNTNSTDSNVIYQDPQALTPAIDALQHKHVHVECCNKTKFNKRANSVEEPELRKRERLGLFKNIRRRLSSLRKSDVNECNGYSDHYQSQTISDSLSHTRLNKRSHRSNSNLNLKLSSTSLSCDNLNKPSKLFSSSKYNEWHSNTNHDHITGSKQKSSCISKDISSFTPEKEKVHDKSKKEMKNCANKDTDKNNSCYELADCVEYDPVKEQTKIWSPKVWSLTQELFRLSKFGWYWGPISRNEAEDKLTNQPDGAFLVRDSSDERYLLSLSFRSYGRTLHTRIEHCNGVFSFYAQPDSEGYPSIVDLIEHSMNESQTGIFYYSRSRAPGAPQFPVWLTKPVSRFTQVRSLQYLCRFVIRQYTRYDHIQQLPLPTTLKGWIEENQY